MRFVETILCCALFITSITNAQAQSYSWKELPGPKLLVTALESVGNQLYAGCLGYGVYRSDDEGMTWKEMNKGMLDGRLVKTFMTTAKYSPGRYTFNLDVQELPAGAYYIICLTKRVFLVRFKNW